MIKKLTVLFAIFFGCVLAEAKTVKKSKTLPEISLQFNEKLYFKLDSAGQEKYLKALLDLAVQVEKNGYKVSDASFLESLLFPTAHAETGILCYLAGIGYYAPSCPNTTADVNNLPESVRGHCAAGQIRCTAAAGLDAQGRSLCIAGNLMIHATKSCVSAGQGAAANRLREKLNTCKTNPSAAGCSDLVSTLQADTGHYDTFCRRRSAKSYCSVAQNAVSTAQTAAGITPGSTAQQPGAQAGGPVVSSSLDGLAGCNEAQFTGNHPGSLARALGMREIDPLWMQLAATASKACGKKMDDVLKVTGVCENKSSMALSCQNQQRGAAECIGNKTEADLRAAYPDKFAQYDTCMAALPANDPPVGQRPDGYVMRGILANRCKQMIPEVSMIKSAVANGNHEEYASFMQAHCSDAYQALKSCASNAANEAITVESLRAQAERGTQLKGAFEALEKKTALSKQQEMAFEDYSGLNSTEFKKVFCAADSQKFKAAVLPLGQRDNLRRRGRVLGCAGGTVSAARADDAGQVHTPNRSNYSSNMCRRTNITKPTQISEQQMGPDGTNNGNYIFYNKKTGKCYKGAGFQANTDGIPRADVPDCPPVKVQAGTRSTTLPPAYLKLEPATSAVGRVDSQYVCATSNDMFKDYTVMVSVCEGDANERDILPSVRQ